MKIRCRSLEIAYSAAQAIANYLERSRFYLKESMSLDKHKMFTNVIIKGVKLREAKPYCGNHAGPCRNDFGKHMKARYLEGLDWVAFNAMLNDALDSVEFDGDVSSTVCIVRKGRKRRIEYGSSIRGGEWDKDTAAEYYVDCIGKEPPDTIVVSGTPGIMGWQHVSIQRP